MKVLVVGSEKWADIDAIWRELSPLWKEHGPHLLVAYPEGGMLGEQIASLCRTAGIDQVVFPLNDKREDPVRRRLRTIFRVVEPDLMLAFHPFIPNSKTTKMAIALAEHHGVGVRQISR